MVDDWLTNTRIETEAELLNSFRKNSTDASEAPSGFDEQWAKQYADRYANRENNEEVVNFLLKYGGSDGTYLDLCCGVGRIAVPLASRGVGVTGVDNAPAMLEVMTERARSASVSVAAILQDCTEVALDETFSLAYVTFNSLFQVGDSAAQEAMLTSAARLLEPGGGLVVEAFVPHPPASSTLQGPIATHVSGSRLETTARNWVLEEQVLWVQRMIVETPGNVRLRSLRFHYQSPAQLDALAERAGFERVAEYTDWSERPLTDDSNNRIAVYRLRSDSPD
ncbi:class I SAM-dependent methyltransferase [Streptomyces griseoviridis]|uniref:Class I SAM-dependent methyltransferase n=1 Tax=Streptomyces griseoviridis TaxID=45398 RepID=A0A3Q9L1Q5_STRGD|nr:class I SAM-dependent methyltransferase [Streptomyces griseoviridis]AZS89602.1 class I SAM-dependent methyltransferase [Streptomyces griseoviridis]QCN83560.1 hypothetical protein DDJ31_00065 [Streptomyces griseoviridis]